MARSASRSSGIHARSGAGAKSASATAPAKRLAKLSRPRLRQANSPWPLRIRTLGHFEVLRDGAPIAFPRKAPGKPLALLKLIVSWGGKPAPQAEICDALWPQAEADAAFDSLSVTVHRLRRLLGDPKSVKLQDGRLSIDTARCQVDAWAFESLLERADDAARSGDAIGATRLCEDTLKHYAGHLLPGESNLPSVLTYREKLRAKFVQRIGRLARQCEKDRRWDAAEALYLRGIEVDELLEAYYQGLMRCHLAQERRADGITLYQHMKHRLFAVLGVAPSSRSQELYTALRGD